ncbi:MAG: hypothetical protein J6I34_05105, partial [Prevotella sp.]|nr:hypothetical protein [Prevotella sp.]
LATGSYAQCHKDHKRNSQQCYWPKRSLAVLKHNEQDDYRHRTYSHAIKQAADKIAQPNIID